MRCERRTEQCEGGGTGRRARLRGVWFTPYGFDSRSSHQPLRAPLRGTQGREVHRPVPVGYAGMAELADALDSGSSESNFMEVQVLLPAPNRKDPNPKPVGKGFGSLYFRNKKDINGSFSGAGAGSLPGRPTSGIVDSRQSTVDSRQATGGSGLLVVTTWSLSRSPQAFPHPPAELSCDSDPDMALGGCLQRPG